MDYDEEPEFPCRNCAGLMEQLQHEKRTVEVLRSELSATKEKLHAEFNEVRRQGDELEILLEEERRIKEKAQAYNVTLDVKLMDLCLEHKAIEEELRHLVMEALRAGLEISKPPFSEEDRRIRCRNLRAEKAITVLKAILAADERGQGLPFAKAMQAAKELVEE